MKKYDIDYYAYNETFQNVNYLESLSETFIFKNYKDILLIDSEMGFPEDISPANIDMYYRLKFRAHNSIRLEIK